MSASAKKQLRKELNAAKLTEKQLKEQKEAKKLKAYTSIFVVAIIVVLVAGLIIAGVNFYKNSGIVEKNTVAVVVGEQELNSVELSYYYNDMVTSTFNEWKASYGDNLQMFMGFMGLDTELPLDEQEYAEGLTWADYFVEAAAEKAKSDYLLCKAAEAEDFQLPEDEQLTLDSSFNQLELFASVYGYADVDAYLRSIYGTGASSNTYYEYSRNAVIASAYYNAYAEAQVADDAAIRAYEADKFDNFSSFSFATYHLGYTNYLTGGTESEDGTIVYTAEEEVAARAAAKADAELIAKSASVEELDKAIAALPVNEGSLTAKSTQFNNSLYTSTSAMYRDWLAADDRKAGDCTVIEKESVITKDDGSTETVVNDYYAVLFLARNDNTMPLANVRHILVNFEGGTTDADGNKTYSDAEKAAALAEAEAILADLTADGVVTDEEFAAAATEKTDDTASAATGGLYEDITPQEGIYVEQFTDWAVDPAREAGETGIIETVYGYHVMYYVGDDEMTYRDYMIANEIRSAAVETWYNNIMASAAWEIKDTSRLNTDTVLANMM